MLRRRFEGLSWFLARSGLEEEEGTDGTPVVGDPRRQRSGGYEADAGDDAADEDADCDQDHFYLEG